MIKTLDKFPLFGPAGNAWIEGRMQDQFGRLERGLLTQVPQALQEPNVPWQIQLADAAKHAEVGLEQGEQTRRTMLVDVTTRLCLLRLMDELVPIARHRALATGRVRREPTARLDGEVSGLLHCLDGKIAGRVDDDRALAADPGDDRRPVFLIMAPTGLALLAAAPRPAAQGLLPTLLRLSLVPRGVIEVTGFDCALQLALHLIGERGIAQPPAPAVARPDMHPDLSGNAS